MEIVVGCKLRTVIRSMTSSQKQTTQYKNTSNVQMLLYFSLLVFGDGVANKAATTRFSIYGNLSYIFK